GKYLSGNRTVSVIPLLSCPVLFCPVLSCPVRGGPRRSAGGECKKSAPNIGEGLLGTGGTSAVRQTVMRSAACYFVAMYLMSSTTLLEWPHSLSYQLTSFMKLPLRAMPASASKMEVRASPMKSDDTTASSV